jgi:UDP-N-acetylmuramate--alanine ligase
MSPRPLRIFYSGIGGSGMSALALFDSKRGHAVSGSDRAFDRDPHHPAYAPLRAQGIRLVPQDGSGIEGSLDFAVMSTAVEDDTPEVLRARELGVHIKRRPDYLAEMVSSFKTVAVSGTSGKSTAAGMLAFAMERLGMEPNFLGGGRVKQFRSETNAGNCLSGGSDLLVIEACESDGSIVGYRPEHTVVLNLSLDHKGIEETSRMFETLASNTPGRVFVNSDDERLGGLGIEGAATFSIDRPSHYRAVDLSLLPLGVEFTLKGVRFRVRQPGKHNAYNALSAAAVLSERGQPLEDISKALAEFEGIERRFEVLLDGERFVVDDYAHNPHKIRALMEAARGLGENVCYVFQPHGYAPARLMKEGYIEAFAEGLRPGDHLAVLPIYYAGGTTSKDVSSGDIAEAVAARGRSAEAVESRVKILENLEKCRNYVVLGARDESLGEFARDIAARLGEGRPGSRASS